MNEDQTSFIRLETAIQSITKCCNNNKSCLFDVQLSLSHLLDSLNNNIQSDFTKSLENQICDKSKINSRIQGFDQKNCLVWKEICKKFGSSLSHNELLSIAQVIASNCNIKVDRDAKRRKEVLIKWFDENTEVILPFLNYMKIDDGMNDE